MDRINFCAIEPEEIEESINKVNQIVKATKDLKSNGDGKVIKFLMGASLLSTILAIVLGIIVNYGLAILFALLCAGLFIFGIIRTSRNHSDELLVEA
jgi:hypothetical protein